MQNRLRLRHWILLFAAGGGLATGVAKSIGEFVNPPPEHPQVFATRPVPWQFGRPTGAPPSEFHPSRSIGGAAGLCAAVLVTFVTGYGFVRLFIEPSLGDGARTLAAGLAVPVGFALNSALLFILMLAGHLNRGGILGGSAALCAGSFIAAVLFGRRPPSNSRTALATGAGDLSHSGVWARTRADALFALVAFIACTAGHIITKPSGDYDAMHIWNARAAALLMAGPDWGWAYSGGVDPAYRDYPLLLPGTVMLGWAFAGEMTCVWPMIVATAFLAAIVITLWGGVRLMGHPRPFLPVLLLLSMPALYRMTGGQRADIPLMSVMSAAAVTLALGLQRKDVRLVALSFGLAGWAGWTKNEGLAFLFATGVVVIIIAARRQFKPDRLRLVRWTAIAGLLPITTIVLFKVSVGHDNDLWTFAADDAEPYGGLVPRTRVIVAALLGRLCEPLYWPYTATIVAVLLSWRRLASWLAPIVVFVVFMAAVYFAVYLATPRGLIWHIEHSIKRLMLHVWPFWVILAAGMDVRSARGPSTVRNLE